MFVSSLIAQNRLCDLWLICIRTHTIDRFRFVFFPADFIHFWRSQLWMNGRKKSRTHMKRLGKKIWAFCCFSSLLVIHCWYSVVSFGFICMLAQSFRDGVIKSEDKPNWTRSSATAKIKPILAPGENGQQMRSTRNPICRAVGKSFSNFGSSWHKAHFIALRPYHIKSDAIAFIRLNVMQCNLSALNAFFIGMLYVCVCARVARHVGMKSRRDYSRLLFIGRCAMTHFNVAI